MRFLILLGVSLVAFCLAETAMAQGGPPRQRVYNPAPKFSPYLYLSRGSVGGVPSYYAWVRPRIDYDQRVRVVDRELQNLELQQTTIQQDVTSLNDPRKGIGQPSTAAQYMYYRHMHYSHYYPESQPRQR